MEKNSKDKRNFLFAIFIVLALVVGAGIGYGWGRAAGTKTADQDPFYPYNSATIVQRTIVAKGAISTIADQTLVLTPTAQTSDEDDKLSITVDAETAIYLQIISGDNNQNSPDKVTLDELQNGDAVDVIMSLDAVGRISANTVSARRSL